jgi:hypothetical protein
MLAQVFCIGAFFTFVQIESHTKPSIHLLMEYIDNPKPPKTWLVESILVTLFCCLPFGIAGIVNAAKVESRFYAGDIEGANKASQDAKKWSLVSLIVGAVFGIIYLIVVVIAGLADVADIF